MGRWQVTQKGLGFHGNGELDEEKLNAIRVNL